MLNEFREYEQYTKNPEEMRRLDAADLTKDFTGIERPLIMVARGLLRTDPDGELLNERCVVCGLRSWCGLRRKKECRLIRQTANGMRWVYVTQEDFRKKSEDNGFAYRVLKNPYNLCLAEEILLEVREDFHYMDTSEMLWDAFMMQPDLLRCRECHKCLRFGHSSPDADTYRKIQSLDGWILRYAKKWYEKGYLPEEPGEKQKRHRLEIEMSGKRSQYDQTLFSHEIRPEEQEKSNTFKKVTYQGIIAKALLMGAFRKCYLAAENITAPEQLGVCVNTASDGNGLNLKNVLSSSEQDVVFKMTAAYLLAGGGTEGEWVPIGIKDVSNWGKSEFKDEKNRAGRLSRYYTAEKQPLFEKKTIGSNITKMRISPEWMKSCGWRLITDEELDKLLAENPSCFYLRDNGGRANLSIRERYE